MSEPAEDKSQRIRRQLERILASATFAGSERHRAFLRFVVEQALGGDTDKLNEFVLGFEVFNKNESFDPRIDSIVRVEARRLRERLKKYYQEEGSADPIVITLRPRSFVPEFDEPGAAPPAGEAPPARRWPGWHKWAALALGALLVVGIALGAVVLWRFKRPPLPQTAAVIVLPFEVLAPAQDQALLGDRIADSLITGLTGIPGLRVISRASGIQFQASGRAPFEFAAELKVDYIVEGTVRASAGRVSVSAKMTRYPTPSPMFGPKPATRRSTLSPNWRRVWPAPSPAHVHVPLPPDLGSRPGRRRTNPEAYGTFLKGQYYWYQWGQGQRREEHRAVREDAVARSRLRPGLGAWLSQSYQLLIMREDGRKPHHHRQGPPSRPARPLARRGIGRSPRRHGQLRRARLGTGSEPTAASAAPSNSTPIGPRPT